MSSAGISSSADHRQRRTAGLAFRVRIALAILAGFSIAAGLPPWGWWPLTLVGAALLNASTDAASARRRFVVGLAVGVPWLAMGMAWMWFLTPPGYVVATLIFASLHGLAAALTPPSDERLWVGPIAHTLVEVLRWSFPFGGVPLATLPIALSASPLLAVTRVGGMVLLTWLVFQIGATMTLWWSERRGLFPLLVCIAVIVVAVIAPSGSEVGQPVQVATVQGGGEQGTTALEVPAIEVFNVHLDATKTIEADEPLDLVTWPENGILAPSDTGFEGSALHDALTAQAERLGVPLLVGLTEDDDFSNHPNDEDSFVNAQIVLYPDGAIGDRYEKVRIVPFGEYVPLRGLLAALGVDLSLIPKDATPGQDPAQLRVNLVARDQRADSGDARSQDQVTVGVMISWEVFFAWRGRDAASNGAEILLNPTNGSSYTWTILQTQQIASSKLRAAENGRWVIQDSPTGFSAFISPSGKVYERTDISEQAVIRYAVPRRTGTTIYHFTGNAPWVAALATAWMAIGIATRRRSRAEGPTAN